MKSGGFHEKWQFLLGNLINQLIQDKSFSFIVCLGEAMSDDSMETTAFHENHRFSWKPHERPPIARNGNPMFSFLVSAGHLSFLVTLFGILCESQDNLPQYVIFIDPQLFSYQSHGM